MDPLVSGLLVSAFVAAGIFLFFVGVTRPTQPDAVQTRLTTYAVRPKTLAEIEFEQPFSERTIKPIIRSLSALLRSRTPEKTLDDLRRDLVLAGKPGNLTVNDFLGLKLAGAIIVGIGATFGSVSFGAPFFVILLAPIAGGALGFFLPNIWLSGKISKRKTEIQLALPDVLDLLVVCVEAGLGFDSAMQKVTEKYDNALTREFAQIIREVRLGKPRREAMRDMVERTQVGDVSSFISAIIQADQLGVSISRILTIQSEQMRLKRRQRAEKLAHQAPIKMLIPMALFMLPTIYLVILGPMVPKLLGSMLGIE